MLSTHLVIKLAQSDIMHWIPNQEYVSQYYDDDKLGYGYGTAIGNTYSDAVAGRDITDRGLSAEGIQFYTNAAQYWPKWGKDNAEFVMNNRGNLAVIQAAFMRDARAKNLIPAEDVFSSMGIKDYTTLGLQDPRLAASYINDPTAFTSNLQANAVSGLNKSVGSRPAFRNALRGPVSAQYFSNKLQDLGEFWSGMASNIGGGMGNILTYIMELLGKVAPTIKSWWNSRQEAANPEANDATAIGGNS